MFMRPDRAGARVHRHALRVAVAYGEIFRCPSWQAGVTCRYRPVKIDADDAGGVGRRVLAIRALAAVAKAGIDHAAGQLHAAAEMMA